ncbi:hypothetical protein BDC45DRAFT_564670 [Circinella umbellata]|nr:hypothetical protein BDC45DRAFT_564670 [Circinella umbellata]
MLAFLDEIHILTRKGTDEKAPSQSEHSSKKSYLFTDLSVNFEDGWMPTEDSLDKMIEDGIDDADITVLGLLIKGEAH